jgi:hypothetical protein
VRDRFLGGRTITGIVDGDVQLERFIREVAHTRPHPVLQPRTVGEVLAEERERLLPLPNPLPETDLITPTLVDRQAFVRFDTNRYSVPTKYTERTLTLVASDTYVRLLNSADCVAQHERSYGKRQVIEVAAHRAELYAERRAARDLKGRDRLRAVAPGFPVLLERWAVSGPSLGLQVTRAIKLLDLYGDEIFAAAVGELVERGLRDTSALAVVCDRLRRERRRPVPVDVRMPEHIEDREVIPHDLGGYDETD